jgi:hypothetical protein
MSLRQVLDVLRKLGILRYGAQGGVYTSAADAPSSMMLDDVYDEKKDLVTREDLARVREAVTK